MTSFVFRHYFIYKYSFFTEDLQNSEEQIVSDLLPVNIEIVDHQNSEEQIVSDPLPVNFEIVEYDDFYLGM